MVVRCRGRNQQEISANSRVVVDTLQSKRDVAVKIGPPDSNSFKTYTVDQVYGPDADQIMMFEQVVSPIVDEFISGLNCTVFAYGQTGTGKTYTMSGDVSSQYETCAYEAGMIPRVLFKLFKSLEGIDCAISVSFTELYNEELKDLLSIDDTNSGSQGSNSGSGINKKLRLVDNPKKGTVNLEGISETHIRSAMEGLEVLRSGMKKRHIGATRMNDVSSRSHAIFAISAAISRVDGTIVRSKMNLVDLAGSENIGKSGAEHKRAREAGIINQSLLTLGRVINALVDKSPHVPYRESKLTRLLQDSLGGETKTCIIATISPASVNCEETLSTLEYASRAKSIKNKPQINTYLRKTLLHEFSEDLAKMRLDLIAARKKNGIYLDENNYAEIMAERESQGILVSELQRRLETMDRQLKAARESADERQMELSRTKRELKEAQDENQDYEYRMTQLSDNLIKCQDRLDTTLEHLTQERDLREAHAVTETALHSVGHQLISSIELASQHIEDLHEVIKRSESKRAGAKIRITDSSENMQENLEHIKTKMNEFSAQHSQSADSLLAKVLSLATDQTERLRNTSTFLADSMANIDCLKEELIQSASTNSDIGAQEMRSRIDAIKQQIMDGITQQFTAIRDVSIKVANQLEDDINECQRQYSNATQYISESQEISQMYTKQSTYIGTKLQMAVAALEEMKTRSQVEQEDQQRDLQRSLALERNRSIVERKKLLGTISSLFEQYASESDERLGTSLKDVLAGSPALKAIHEDAERVSQGIKTTMYDNEQFHETINGKIENLNKIAAETDMNGSAHLSHLLSEFRHKCESVIDTEMNSMESSVQALDHYLLESGEYNRQQSAIIANGIANMYSTVRGSFGSLDEYLKELQNGLGEISSPERTKELLQQMTSTWQAVSDMIFTSTESMVQRVFEVRQAVSEDALPEIRAPKRPRLEYEQLVLPKTQQPNVPSGSNERGKADRAGFISTSALSASSTASTGTAEPRTSDVSMEDVPQLHLHGEENIPENDYPGRTHQTIDGNPSVIQPIKRAPSPGQLVSRINGIVSTSVPQPPSTVQGQSTKADRNTRRNPLTARQTQHGRPTAPIWRRK